MNKDNSFLSNFIPFIIGGVSGAFATCIIQPIDTFKVQIQVHSQKLGLEGAAKTLKFIKIFKTILNNQQGLSVFYRGLDSAILRQLVYGSARLGAYNFMVQKYKNQGINLTMLQKSLLSIMSGIFGAIVGNPFDVALIRRQASITQNKVHYRNTFHAFANIIKTEGVLTLWKGINITMLRVVLINLGQQISYEIIKNKLEKIQYFTNHLYLYNFCSSLAASCITSFMALPADNIKVKIQKSLKTQNMYTGIIDCFNKTVQRQGFRKLWVGFPIFLIRGAPHSIILIQTQDYLRKLYEKSKSKQ